MTLNTRIFYHLNSDKIFFYLFLIIFALQVIFWYKTKDIKPNYDIVPHTPSKLSVKALSLGDEEFLFRSLATRLQNSGDVFAGFVALRKYDYQRLYNWFTLLDELNAKSNLVPALASYYYSQTQNKSDLHYVIKYLDERYSKNMNENWWWQFQAIQIAQKDLSDNDLALRLSYKLADNTSKDAPLWTKQMPAFILANMGHDCLSFKIIEHIMQENEQGKRILTADEINFMRYFVDERLSRLHNTKFDPKKCQ